jgi:putative membrane protein
MIEYDKHRWSEHLLDVEGSMVKEIVGRVSVCVLWSPVVVAFHQLWKPLAISATTHTLVGVALGLLLVFRTNASYDRFWEGRKCWGSIVNESRNLARGLRTYVKGDSHLVNDILRWTAAFAFATKNSLRGNTGLGRAGDRLPAAEVESVLQAEHVPLAVTLKISERLAEVGSRGLTSDIILMALDRNVQALIDQLGACERILKTPLPFVYVVHLRRALILYCFTLPMAIVGFYGWWTILVTLLTAYMFFGIEEIGVEIENPFGGDDNDLPLERICDTIDQNLMALLVNDAEDRVEGSPHPPWKGAVAAESTPRESGQPHGWS